MSRRSLACVLGGCLALALGFAASMPNTARAAGPDWAANLTVIEACSCPMFCQCYFNAKPAAHGGHEGHAAPALLPGQQRLQDQQGPLRGHQARRRQVLDRRRPGRRLLEGPDGLGRPLLRQGPDHRRSASAIQAIVGHLFPVKWKLAQDRRGRASTVGVHQGRGRTRCSTAARPARCGCKGFPGMSGDPVVIKNLKYWGAPRNDGFVLMPNEVEAYRVGPERLRVQGHERLHADDGHQLEGHQAADGLELTPGVRSA